jgi:TRAP-type C4-dicarboxylate transport system substrate-binding protein
MIGLFLSNGLLEGQKYTIKFATIAPEGSTWMLIMHEFNKELSRQTNGEVSFKIYAGGILGDEKDVLRKIRIGQLHAAGFTGVGMGEIVPNVRILDTPLLLRNYDEVDYIYEQFGDYFAENFSKNGYELLGWAEVGFVYIFTKRPVNNLDELRQVKMWVWQGDRVAEATFKAFGISPVPLSIVNVMTALQTNMINGVYASPLAVVALQWFTKVQYMMEIPLVDAAGAMLISKKMYNKIPEEYQKILKSLSQKYMTELTRLSREENNSAIETLKQNEIKIIPQPDSEILKSYYKIGVSARQSLVGEFYSQDLLDSVESVLKEFRANNHN